MAGALDEALEDLYRVPPAEFTRRRDELARARTAAGDPEGAAALRARRRPTQVAYVLNQLARRHADDVAALVDVGRELARAQRKALRGEHGGDLRDAIARQRDVVGALTQKTAALMRELGVEPSGHLDEIAGALQAALVDSGVGEALEEGRLEKAPAAAAGFPGAVELAEVRGRERERGRGRERERGRERAAAPKGREREAKEAREREAKEAREREAKEAARTGAAAAKAEAALARAEAEARDLAAAQAEAEAREKEAETLAREAKALAAEARGRAKKAAAAAREATRARRAVRTREIAARRARDAADAAEKRARPRTRRRHSSR